MTDKHERLRAMLRADLGDEADDLLDTVARLSDLPAPVVEAEQTAKLTATLKFASPPNPLSTGGEGVSKYNQIAPLRLRRGDGGEAKRFNLVDWPPLLLMRAQLRVVQGEILIASALVMLLGVVVTLLTFNMAYAGVDLPLVLIAPIVAAVGLTFLYSTEVQSIAEIEHATSISPSLVLLARLTLVFTFDFASGLIGSIILTLTQPDLSLWPLVGAWLAPMAFLSALAFLISVVFVDPLVGILISFTLWVALIMIRFVNANPYLRPLSGIPDLLAANFRPWLLVLAIPLFAVALLINQRRDLIIKGSNS